METLFLHYKIRDKMRLLYILALLLIFAACNTDQTPSAPTIADLENMLATDASKKGDLIAAYDNYINTNPTDNQLTPQYLLKASKLALEDNRVQQMIPMLVKLLRKFPKSDSYKEGLETLANLYGGKLNLPALAKPLFAKLQGMDADNKAANSFLGGKIEIPVLADYLEGLKKTFIDTESGEVNRTAIRDYQRGVSVVGLTSSGPENVEWLLSGGETARMVKNNQGAIDFYNWILEDYANNPKAAQALFLKAFTYDNELNQDEAARPMYESFLAKYPDNDFADDAKFLLNNLGKSDEEIIEGFQKPAESK